MRKREPFDDEPQVRRKFPWTVKERRQALQNYLDVTCKKSASLKGIEAHQELKSILFRNDDGFVMAHVPGDTTVDEDALAEVVGRVTIIPKDELASYRLEKGRVNPFTAELYLDKVVHVVCNKVFENETVHSNNDRVGGWIEFRPQDILQFVWESVVHPISKRKGSIPDR